MNLILSVALLLSSLPAPAIVGEVTYYGPGVMERTYRNRLAWGHVAPCAECIGMVALRDRANVGRRVWLQRPGHAPEKFLVVDCGTFLTKGRVAEVDWLTARRWRMAGPLKGVRVLFEESD